MNTKRWIALGLAGAVGAAAAWSRKPAAENPRGGQSQKVGGNGWVTEDSFGVRVQIAGNFVTPGGGARHLFLLLSPPDFAEATLRTVLKGYADKFPDPVGIEIVASSDGEMLKRSLELHRPDPPGRPPRIESVSDRDERKGPPAHPLGYYRAQFWRHASGLEFLGYSPDPNSGEYVYVTITPKRIAYSGDPSTDLLLAAREGDEAKVSQLLASGANTAARDAEGDTALTSAARDNHPSIIRALIASGADVNAVSNDGSTALMYMASNGNPELVALLLRAGALVNLQDKYGLAALHCAARNSAVEAFRDKTGLTEFHSAVPGRGVEIVILLLDSGADIDAQDSNGETPLMCAAQSNETDVVRVLIGRGANPAIKNHDGRTAADIVRDCSSCSDLLRLLPVKKPR